MHRSKTDAKSRTDIAAVVFLLLLGVGFTLPAIVAGGILGRYPSDGTRLLYFIREFLLTSLHDGRLPLWNPYTYFGAPFLADIQWGTLYPPNLAFALLPVDLAYNLFVGLHLALAGVSMFALARCWNLPAVPALIAGMAFMLSGRLVTWASGGAVNILSATAWLPLVVLCFDRALTARPARFWGALTALVLGLQILSGHPQFTLYALIAIFWAAIWQTRTLRRTEQTIARTLKPTIVLLVVVAAAVGLAAAQIAPTYEASTLR